MKTREFDPVLSAALRNELEALAGEAREAAARRAVLRRPRVRVIAVTAVTAVLLVLATVGVLRVVQPPVRVAPPAAPAIADPLAQLKDPAYPEHVEGVLPLLQVRGVGPAAYPIDIPKGVSSVRAVIRCAPAAQFRITIGKWVSSECEADSQGGFGDMPIGAGRKAVSVAVPEGTAWRMVVIATPGAVRGAVAASDARPAAFPAPEFDSDVPVGLARGGSGTTSGRLDAAVDELAVVTSCRGSGGLVITLSNGLRLGTDEAPIPCGADARWTGAANDDTARGYRSAGRMTWTVRAIGDVTWRATFSSRTEERLPYPDVTGTVLARTRGSGVDAYGSLARPVGALKMVVTCRGTGSLTISAQESGARFSGGDGLCGPDSAKRTETSVSKPGGLRGFGVQHYEIRPTGSILWTVTFLAD